jgi:dienelactone hydrolase
MRAALALPASTAPRPAVIVIHEIFGLNDDIRRITGRFADLGWVALAPDLYDTEGCGSSASRGRCSRSAGRTAGVRRPRRGADVARDAPEVDPRASASSASVWGGLRAPLRRPGAARRRRRVLRRRAGDR